MASFEYNPLCESVTVTYECPHCGHVNKDTFSVPAPDFMAETHHDSVNQGFSDAICEKCNQEYNVILTNGFYGGNGEIENVDSIIDVEEEYAEVDDDYENYVFDVTPEKITDVLDEIETLSNSTKEYLHRQLYAGSITSMEAFLSSTLLKAVLSSDETKRKFVEKYLPYHEKQISFATIYEQMDKIENTIQETLRGLMYHNLGKIKPIYKDVLDIDLGDIRDVMKAVQIRHDIVHRSGKDKEGNLHEIKKEDVSALVEKVSYLMSSVTSKLPIDDSFINSIDTESPWDDLLTEDNKK